MWKPEPAKMLSDCFYPLRTASAVGLREPHSIFNVAVVSRRAMGSSYVQVGESKVVALAHVNQRQGQKDGVDQGVLECNVEFANYLIDAMSNSVQGKVNNLGNLVTTILAPSVLLNKYAKHTIAVCILILQSSQSDLCAIVNSASLALLDARVELLDLCCCCKLDSHDNTVSITLAALPLLGVVTGTSICGPISGEKMEGCVDDLVVQCKAIREQMVAAVADSYRH